MIISKIHGCILLFESYHVLKMLSLMTITRERESDFAGWKADGSGDTCAGE